mmetsp:Transcript_22445/g.66553  ORF Transcript_22445/g.66553 Transcript_22445/m.66553 type:complete len:245 (-) Transcript_22445:208-942(-)
MTLGLLHLLARSWTRSSLHHWLRHHPVPFDRPSGLHALPPGARIEHLCESLGGKEVACGDDPDMSYIVLCHWSCLTPCYGLTLESSRSNCYLPRSCFLLRRRWPRNWKRRSRANAFSAAPTRQSTDPPKDQTPKTPTVRRPEQRAVEESRRRSQLGDRSPDRQRSALARGSPRTRRAEGAEDKRCRAQKNLGAPGGGARSNGGPTPLPSTGGWRRKKGTERSEYVSDNKPRGLQSTIRPYKTIG